MDNNDSRSGGSGSSDFRFDLKSQVADAVNKILLTGVGTVFLTQEAVKGLLGEVKLPKELMSALLENASKQKQEFFQIIAKEAASVFSRIDVAKEIQKAIEGHTVQINIQVSFDPKTGDLKASSGKSKTSKKDSAEN